MDAETKACLKKLAQMITADELEKLIADVTSGTATVKRDSGFILISR